MQCCVNSTNQHIQRPSPAPESSRPLKKYYLARRDFLRGKFLSGTLKLQSVTFAFLSPSMFENLELQFLAELSSVRGVVIRFSGTAPVQMNLMF